MKKPKRYDFFEDDVAAIMFVLGIILLVEKIFLCLLGDYHWILMITYGLISLTILTAGRLYKRGHVRYDKWYEKYGEKSEEEAAELLKEETRKKELEKFEKFYNGKTRP